MSQFIRIDEYAADAFQTFDGTELVITTKLVLFWKPPNPFGQWTASPFEIDGKHYCCAEQYMMAEKARLFGDTKIEAQIMNSDDPRYHQQLGKRVFGFEQSLWTAERCKIVFRGNFAKFTQNRNLGDLLIETENRRLVEASPIDKIWGIGIAANDPFAYDQKNWRGLNLLGGVLEDGRNKIKRG